MKTPLSEILLSKRKELIDSLSKHNSFVNGRISYIAQCVCETFEYKLSYWVFTNSTSTYDVGDFDKSIYNDNIDIIISPIINYRRRHSDFKIILDGKEVYILNHIPLRWLTQDFEDELKTGRDEFLKKLSDEKQQQIAAEKKKKEVEKEASEIIKNKLTKDELKILKKAKVI